ncbi:hypothetical protein L3V86_09120 [Thiotrichales bacterium 19S11-10]|nr:hypothetical protein [Thiotrichales bacterium 19S11-10]
MNKIKILACVLSLLVLNNSAFSYDESIYNGDHWSFGSTEFKLHITADPIDSCIYRKLNASNLIIDQTPPWTQNYFY